MFQAERVNTEKVTQHGGEYLTFLMDGEEYGVDILSVQEIRGWTGVRVIPNTPDYIKGIIDLRGEIVPIIDMRQRFGLKPHEYNNTTVVIVLNAGSSHGGDTTFLGIVVDAVSEVYDLQDAKIKKSPNFGSKIQTEFILGMANVNDKIILLIDINKLLNPKEFYEMQEYVDKKSELKDREE